MMNDHATELLIGLAEGTLPADRRAEADRLLQNSEEARRTLATLRAAFEELNAMDSGNVPDRYFAEFLPRMRERLVRPAMPFRIPVPHFLIPMLRPVMAFAGLLLCVTAYRVLEPQNGTDSLYDLVRDAAQEEIMSVLTETGTVFATAEESSLVLSSGPDMFGIDAVQPQTESDLDILLEDQELDRVIRRLETSAQ